jgi:hypothetical protein
VSSVRNYGTAPVEVEQGGSGELHGVEAKPLRGSVGLKVRRSSVAAAEQSGGVDLSSGRCSRGKCGALGSQGRFKEGGTVIAALGSGKGIPAGSPVISGVR